MSVPNYLAGRSSVVESGRARRRTRGERGTPRSAPEGTPLRSRRVLASRRAHTLRGLVIVFYTVMTTRCSTVPAWVPVYVIQPTKSVAL